VNHSFASWRSILAATFWSLAAGAAWAQQAPAEVPASIEAPQPVSFESLLAQLPGAGYADKGAIVVRLVNSRHASARAVLRALLDGKLHARTADGAVFITETAGENLKLIDPVTQQNAGTAPESELSKIGTNNQLRKVLKGAIAQLDLTDEDPKARLRAVGEMLRTMDESNVSVLRDLATRETDADVKEAIAAGLALADLDSADAKVRLAAITALQGSLNNDVYNRLASLIEKNSDGSEVEPDPEVRSAAAVAVRSIQSWRSLYSSIETLFFGLSLGSVLVLAAIGLAITFGVMGVINMAHGELMMLGAYTAYVMQLIMPNHLGLSIALSIPAAFIVSGLVGVGIERGIVRFLYGRPLETLLATFGVSLALQQLVRSVFSPNNVPVSTPEFMSGSLQISEALSLTYNRLYIVVFTAIVFIGLQLVLRRTSLGLKVRAVSQNRSMARAMGVRTEWVDAATFGLGSGIAGVAGVALSQLTNVGPNLGQAYIIDSFMVVVFGGVGNLWGTVIGGMFLGVVNKLLEPYSGAVLAKILMLVFLILFIQSRPRGLFPQKGRAADGH
jgi:urea transport system permease protein